MTVIENVETLAAVAGNGCVGPVGASIAVCVPARNEAATISSIVGTLDALSDSGLVAEVVVVDDHSTDATAALARDAGAVVVPSSAGPGKGQALGAAVAATSSEIVVFVDADVTNFSTRFVSDLVAPLLTDPSLQMVKGSYRRPLAGVANEGGRVTELLARPLLRRFFCDLASIDQPLAGETALRRSALDGITLADGYGVEIGLLIDIYRRFGRNAIAEVDLGQRVHRNRPLRDLRPHAEDILAAVLDRLELTIPGSLLP